MRPLSDRRYPIVGAGKLPGLENYDLMLCSPGQSTYPRLPRLSEFTIGHEQGGDVQASRLANSISITSLLTGERAECFALTDKDGTQHMLAALGAVPGESGTGFVEDDDGALYVLKGHLMNIKGLAPILPQGVTEVSVFIRLVLA